MRKKIWRKAALVTCVMYQKNLLSRYCPLLDVTYVFVIRVRGVCPCDLRFCKNSTLACSIACPLSARLWRSKEPIASKYTCLELDILAFVVLFYFLTALYTRKTSEQILLRFTFRDTAIRLFYAIEIMRRTKFEIYLTYYHWFAFRSTKSCLPVPALAVWLSVCAGLFPLYKPLFTFSLFSASCCHSF